MKHIVFYVFSILFIFPLWAEGVSTDNNGPISCKSDDESSCLIIESQTSDVVTSASIDSELPIEPTIQIGRTPKDIKAKPVYDYSNLSSEMTIKGDLCLGDYKPTLYTQSGRKIKMLGYAFIYQGPQRGTSIMGHISERFAYCRDNHFVDVLYENYPLDLDLYVDKTKPPTETNPLSIRLDGEARGSFITKFRIEPENVSAQYLQAMTKSMLIQIDYDPMKSFAVQQLAKNRTIFEAWLKVPEDKMYQMLLAAENRREEQNKKIATEVEIPGFSLFDNNCMNNPKENLRIINPAFTERRAKFKFTPKLLWNYVRGLKVEKIVIYPSQRMFRKIRMKEQGHSAFFENIVPFSKTAKRRSSGGWMFMTLDPVAGKRNAFLTPVAGLLNTATALVETAYGIITLPLQLIGKIFHIDTLRKKTGTYKIKMGFYDLLTSLAETAYIKVRYPMPTNEWTDEELEFAQDMNQASVMLEYLRVKNRDTTLYIQQENNLLAEQ